MNKNYFGKHPRKSPLYSASLLSIAPFYGIKAGEFLNGVEEETPRPRNETEVQALSKDDYMRIMKEKRREFVHKNFYKVLQPLFSLLNKDAELMRVCHREITIDIPEQFDVDKTESMLCMYFSDLGYKSLTEPRKDNSVNKITITIT